MASKHDIYPSISKKDIITGVAYAYCDSCILTKAKP